MNYVVIDLEYNQPFLFNDGTRTEPVPECPFEIIQIGAVKLNREFEIIDKVNIMIKPKLYDKIHPYVRDITGIDEAMLENCIDFTQGYKDFIKFIGKGKNIFCVWGNNDIKELCRNILYYNLSDNFLPKSYINVQSLSSRHFSRPGGMCIGLKNAVELLEIETDIPFHNALNDAIYTAMILKRVKSEDMPVVTFQTDQYKPLNKTAVKPNLVCNGNSL